MTVKMLSYSDALLVPDPTLTIKYTGKNVLLFFNPKIGLRPILMDTLEIDSPKFYEDRIQWDGRSGSFQGKWKGKKPFDRWSGLLFEVEAFGSVNLRSKEQEGSITIKLKPFLVTSIEYAHELQRMSWWLYSNIFYNHQRRTYLAEGMDYFRRIRDRVYRLYGMEMLPAPEAAVPR